MKRARVEARAVVTGTAGVARRGRVAALVAFAAPASLPLALAVTFGACHGSPSEAPGDAAVSDDRMRLAETQHPDAACAVAIDTPALLAGTHVPIGTDVQWDSNPPSSGSHFPVWAAFQAYAAPVPRGYYVHDLEHGAVVLLYKCDADAGEDCAAIAAALQGVSDAIPDDPLCTSAGGAVRVRTVITPDPLLDVPIAAAAWGWTYRAGCLDLPTLTEFAKAHYGQGPEVLCANGQAQF